jgi:diacylglycerol kinase family enzyme
MRALLLHNPKAGDNRVSAEDLVRAFAKAGYEVRYCVKDDEAGFAAGLAAGPDLVAVAGGDGSVGQLLRFHAALTMPVALLPLGTSNNIARSFGMSTDVLSLIPRLRDAPARRLDVGIANGPWGYRLFVESVGLGLLAPMMTRRIEAETAARARALVRKSVIATVKRARAARLWLSVDGRVIEEEVLMAEVTSISRVGPALPLLRESHTGDGMIDAVLLRASDRAAMVAWLKDEEAGSPPVKAYRGRVVAARWDGLPLRIDDRKMRKPDREPAHVFVRLIGAEIGILVPEGGA